MAAIDRKVAPEAIDRINRRTYQDPKATAEYPPEGGLQAAEASILARIGPEVRGGRILDVGVGPGRTLPHLMRLSSDYVGIDYSAQMVAACRARFPAADLRVADARNLVDFSDGMFQLVLFSFNGIDYVPHEDRRSILSEAHRVLAPGGYFVFSAHNAHWLRAEQPPQPLAVPRRPLSALKWLARTLVGRYHHLRHRRFEVHAATYSIVNDLAHDYRLLTYFIRIEHQLAQLRAAGFDGPLTAFDRNGQETLQDATSPWIYYCARKR